MRVRGGGVVSKVMMRRASALVAVLFISVRLRAAQMYDTERGDPPVWMQAAFYVCAFSVVAQTLMAFATRGSQDIIVHEGGHIDVIAGKRPGKGVMALEGAGLVAKAFAPMLCATEMMYNTTCGAT